MKPPFGEHLAKGQGVSDMPKGPVKFFDSRPERRFGFIRLETGGDLFFHFNDGQIIVPGGSEPEFSGKSMTTDKQGRQCGLRDPRIGDILVYQRSSGSQGPKAYPWGYQSQWEAMERFIANRPVYRVLEQMTSTGFTPGEPKILWEGSDLSELARKYPVPTGRVSPGADPLLSYSSYDDFEIRRWWEVKKGDNWSPSRDPRELSGVLRQFEEINRRS